MAHVFISYAYKEKKRNSEYSKFFDQLKSRLKRQGFKVWTDEMLSLGEKWSPQIEENIRQSFAMIVIATQYAMERDWVRFEFAYALGTQAKVIVIKLEEFILPQPLPDIQNMDEPFQPYEWDRLFKNLRSYRDNSWMKYWIPANTLPIIRSSLEGLMETDDALELEMFARILAKYRTNSAEILISALDCPDEIIRAKAAWALGPIKDERAVKPLINALDDKYPVVIAHAAGALGHIGDKKAIFELSRLLSNNSVFSSLARQPYRQDTISNQAYMALNLIGAPEALAVVEKWKQEQGR